MIAHEYILWRKCFKMRQIKCFVHHIFYLKAKVHLSLLHALSIGDCSYFKAKHRIGRLHWQLIKLDIRVQKKKEEKTWSQHVKIYFTECYQMFNHPHHVYIHSWQQTVESICPYISYVTQWLPTHTHGNEGLIKTSLCNHANVVRFIGY